MIAECRNAHALIDGYAEVPADTRVIRWGDTYYARMSPDLQNRGTVVFVQTHCFIPREGLKRTHEQRL